MKKWLTKKNLLILCVLVAFCVAALGAMYAVDRFCMQKNKPVIFSTWGYQYVPPETSAPDITDLIPMVRIDGVLYMDTGLKSTTEERCGMPDGEILTSVSHSEVPQKNDESNFGTGFSYQYGEKGTVELLMHGTWWIFATREKKQEMLFPKGEQSFVGTVLEETDTDMLICPNEDEKERICGEKIRVRYEEPQPDVRYGIGARVVVFYEGEDFGTEISAKEILTDGYMDFTLRTTADASAEKHLVKTGEIQGKDALEEIHLYFVGVSEVAVVIGEESFSLENAIESGKITWSGLVARVQKDASEKRCDAVSYRDGGSILYRYPEYTLIKYNTKDGNRDIYIGTTSMDIRAKDE